MDNEVLELLRETDDGYHPLVSLLKLSSETKATITEKITCHKEIAKYIMPQLKAVESKIDLTGELGALKIIIDQDGGSESQLAFPHSEKTSE